MSIKSSRYYYSKSFTDVNGQAITFKGSRSREIGPATGVLEYTIKEGDRMDLLALYFYNDSQKWWRLLDANPDTIFAADLTLSDNVGETILIPKVSEPGVKR